MPKVIKRENRRACADVNAKSTCVTHSLFGDLVCSNCKPACKAQIGIVKKAVKKHHILKIELSNEVHAIMALTMG